MKKILSLLIKFFFAMQLVSAQKNATSMLHLQKVFHDFYRQNLQTNLAVGLVLSINGSSMSAAEVTMNIDQPGSIINLANAEYNLNKGASLSCLGIASTLSSIPLFISTKSNLSKARLSLKGESVAAGDKMFYNFDYTAIALTILL